MNKKCIAIAAAALALAGCATVPTMENPKRRDIVLEKPFAEAWSGLTSAATQSGYFVNAADKDSGLITFTMNLTKQESKDFIMQKPPSFPIGGYYDKSKAYITLNVKDIDGKSTKITAMTKIESAVHNMFGESLEYMQGKAELNSNGGVEDKVFKMIQTQVGVTDYKFMDAPATTPAAPAVTS